MKANHTPGPWICETPASLAGYLTARCYPCSVQGLDTPATTTAPGVYGDEHGGIYRHCDRPDVDWASCDECRTVALGYAVRCGCDLGADCDTPATDCGTCGTYRLGCPECRP